MDIEDLVSLPIILAISYLSLTGFNLLFWVCGKLPTCKRCKCLGYLVLLVIGGLTLALDLTFGLVVLMLLALLKVSDGQAEKEKYLQLVLASQFLFTHMDDFVVEIWRF
jgi:hypothetical protein